MAKTFPARADVVIIGGGIVGASIAYHLTKIGITNVVLLERKQLTSGTTWHAAGLVGQLRASRNLTELAKYTTGLFEGLEKETGQATGFKQNGSISIALTEGRMEELKRGASMAKNFGLAVDVISTAQIKERIPHYNLENVVGGVFRYDHGRQGRDRRWHVVARPGADDRRQHPASCLRAFLHRQRADRGPAAQHAGGARSG
jgi:4-methylaminobutanoate oxidase (formaldehyde-forming)